MIKKSRILLIIVSVLSIAFFLATCDNPTNDGSSSQPGLPALTGTITISGTAQAGQTLTADVSLLKGSGIISFQWLRSDAKVLGSGSSYDVTEEDEGFTITVIVTRSDNSGSITSAATNKVAPPDKPLLTGTVTIDNISPKVGDILTATYTPGNGTGTATWQWLRDDTVIPGANSNTYTFTAADLDKSLKAQVSYENQSGRATSEPIIINSISSVSINVTSPVKAQIPDTAASGTGNYTIGAVSWNPGDNPFFGGIAYTATVTLTAKANYTFTEQCTATINGNTATITNNTGNTVTLSYTFKTTDVRDITGISILTQPSKLTYTHGDTLNLSGLVVRISYNDTSKEDIALADFAGKNLSAKPSDGAQLKRSDYNGKPVVVSLGTYMANTDNLTINPKAISISTVAPPAARTYDGTLSATPGAVTYSGLVSGESLALNTDYTVSAAFTNVSAGSGNKQYTYTVTMLNTATANNYSLAQNTINESNGTINPKPITISGFGITRAFNGTNTGTVNFGTLSFNGLVSDETAEVDASGVTATYDGPLVGQHNITIGGNFAMTGGTAAPANYTITPPTGITGTITLVTPNAPNSPGQGTVTHNTVTLTAPTGGDVIHSYLAMEYAYNSTNSAPASGWQDALTFNGLSTSTSYYFFARYKADAAKNNLSPASAGFKITTSVPSFGDLNVTSSDLSSVYYTNNTVTFTGNGTYTISMKSGITSTVTDRIVVASGVTTGITLSGVNIDMSGAANKCAFDMTGATVNLTLMGINVLKSSNSCAGLQVPDGTTLVIMKASTGSLYASSSGSGSAGIGGGNGQAGGNITILGGIITAISDYASIGAGRGGSEGILGISGGIIYIPTDSTNLSITTLNGNAVIIAGTSSKYFSGISISLPTSGNLGPAIIINGQTGTMYGNVTLSQNITIPNSVLLGIDNGQTLTITSGTTLTNNGIIYIDDGGSIINAGTIVGNQPVKPSLTVSGGSAYTYKRGILDITGNGTYNISMRNGITTLSPDTIYVSSPDITANITISSININGSTGTFGRPFIIEGENATVNLTLVGNNVLSGGVEVPEGTTFEITNLSTGSLSATGNVYKDGDYFLEGAGIGCGGRFYGSCGTIIINGGTVNASSQFAAGIGGGSINQNNFSGGTITINGGTVNATGGLVSAGIGGVSSDSSDRTITINGGTVSATGSPGAAGIGGGDGGSGGTITINGGTVTATTTIVSLLGGGTDGGGAGIGGGNGGSGGNITITGGTVTAIAGNNNAAAIGRGSGGAMENVNISNVFRYWTNTLNSDPGGSGTLNSVTPFIYSNTYKYIKLEDQ